MTGITAIPVEQSLERSDDQGFTFQSLFQLLAPFLKFGVGALSMIVVLAGVTLLLSGARYAGPFLMVGLASLIPLWTWVGSYRYGIPYLFFLVFQQGLIYLLPLYLDHPSLKEYQSDVITTGAIALAIFFIFLTIGWRSGSQKAQAIPSKWNISTVAGEGAVMVFMKISTSMLAVALIGQIIPFYVNIGGLGPVLSAGFNAAGTLGALLGGYAMGAGKRTSIPYWVMFSLIFLISIRDILLSAPEQMILACVLGMALGSRKIPWKVLMIMVAVLGFLSAGKFHERDKYWIMDNQTHVPLTGLPSLYLEWSQASIDALSGKGEKAISQQKLKERDSGSFAERINNYHSLAFIIRAEKEMGIPPLYGQTYSLIIPLFIPRIFWEDKPRAHAGQDLLNVYFKRQRLQDIDFTFIAWGMLPEAIGNWGVWLGPVFFGLLAGWLLGYAETWSIQKQLFSIEGLAALGLWMQLLLSWEMVSSLWITSTFQMMVVIVVGGLFLRSSFGGRKVTH